MMNFCNMKFKDYKTLMKNIAVGCKVRVSDYDDWNDISEKIVTEIKLCKHKPIYKELRNSCCYCAGYIGLNNNTPICCLYSDPKDNRDDEEILCLIFEIVTEDDFIEPDEMKI